MDIQIYTCKGSGKANAFMKTVKVVSVQAETIVAVGKAITLYHITYETGS